QHLRLERLAHAPEELIRDAVDTLPEFAVAEAVRPAEAEVALEYLVPLLREEGRDVNAVGDVGKGIFLRLHLGPQSPADGRRHLAVDARDAVLEARAADRERGPVEVVVPRRAA